MAGEKIRVLLAKTGLCCHDIGVKFVATTFKNAGIETVYIGKGQTPESIANSAIQEDVDAIGISIVSHSAVPEMKEIMETLTKKGIDIPLICGGRINRRDIPTLKEIGVKGIFRSGTPPSKLVQGVKEIISRKQIEVK